MIIAEQFTGLNIRYRIHEPDVGKYMQPYASEVSGEEYDIFASRDLIEKLRPYYSEGSDDAYVEYKSFIELTSRWLISYRRCLFHAVAFCWKGKAWLFTGPSGTGKTTQYKKWKILYRDEVQMICGDMPLLEWKTDGQIWVHPSPWNGKERIKGKIAAPLGGIVILEQSKENEIERMKPFDSGVLLFLQMAIRPETEEQILQMSEMINHILDLYPVWKLKNRGDKDSVEMMSATILNYITRC